MTSPQDRKRRRSFSSIVAATWLATVGAAALQLGNVVVTARALDPTGRGNLVFLTTVAGLTAALASFGIEEANGNIAATEPGARRALATNSFLLALLFGAAGAGVVAGLISLFPAVGPERGSDVRWFALAVIPLLIFQLYLQLLIRAEYGFLVTNVALLLAPVVTLAVNAPLAATGTITVARAFAAWVVGQAVGNAVLVWYVQRRLRGFGRPDRALARRAFVFGVKSHLGRVMKTGNYRLDQWLVGAIAGSRELGLYSTAVAWSEALFYLPDALVTVMRPDVARADEREAERQTAAVFRAAVWVSLPFVAGLVLAAPLLCVGVFGSAFRGSIGDLRVLALGTFGVLALKLFSNALTAQGKPLLANAGVALGFLTTVALDVTLIPGHGGFGAAVASSVAYTAGGIATALVFVTALRGTARSLVPGLRDLRNLVAILRRRGHDSQATPSPPHAAS